MANTEWSQKCAGRQGTCQTKFTLSVPMDPNASPWQQQPLPWPSVQFLHNLRLQVQNSKLFKKFKRLNKGLKGFAIKVFAIF